MTTVLSPCPGRVLAISECVDEVFATEIVGPGVVIEPTLEETVVVSPIAGKVVKVHPHAFVVLGAGGVGVLVHLGINTVHLEGAGFTVLTNQGATVEAGDPMVSWNPATITGADISTQVPVVVMDRKPGTLELPEVGAVDTGDVLFDA